jgi:hypothetical protein
MCWRKFELAPLLTPKDVFAIPDIVSDSFSLGVLSIDISLVITFIALPSNKFEVKFNL